MTATATVETEKKMTAIEAALAAARARKAQREANGTEDGTLTMETAPEAVKKPARMKTLNEKVEADRTAKAGAAAAARAEKEAARAAAKAQRDAERETRRAAKAAAAAEKKATHMSKVERAGSRLPSLNESAQKTFEDIVSNLGVDQLNAMAMHLQHTVRTRLTQESLNAKLSPGQKVRIVTSADPRFIGAEGTIERAQRIRCFVAVPGSKKPVYLFTSDVRVIA